MELVVAFLVEWLSLNTDIKMRYFPHIEIVPHHKIVELSGIHAHALYHWEQERIYISGQVDLTTMHGVSVVLHEMVHHHQNKEGLLASYTCKNEAERLAYETQKQFLTAMKASMMIEMDPAFIDAASHCSQYQGKSLAKKMGQ